MRKRSVLIKDIGKWHDKLSLRAQAGILQAIFQSENCVSDEIVDLVCLIGFAVRRCDVSV